MKKNVVTKKIAEDFFFAGVKAERERIIKLLETVKGEKNACCADCQPHQDIHRQYMAVLIDLINGQDK